MQLINKYTLLALLGSTKANRGSTSDGEPDQLKCYTGDVALCVDAGAEHCAYLDYDGLKLAEVADQVDDLLDKMGVSQGDYDAQGFPAVTQKAKDTYAFCAPYDVCGSTWGDGTDFFMTIDNADNSDGPLWDFKGVNVSCIHPTDFVVPTNDDNDDDEDDEGNGDDGDDEDDDENLPPPDESDSDEEPEATPCVTSLDPEAGEVIEDCVCHESCALCKGPSNKECLGYSNDEALWMPGCHEGFVLIPDEEAMQVVADADDNIQIWEMEPWGECKQGKAGAGLMNEPCDQDKPNSGCLEDDYKCGKIEADPDHDPPIKAASYCMTRQMCQSEPMGHKEAWCGAFKVGASVATAVAVAYFM